jgi:hypothetical protein
LIAERSAPVTGRSKSVLSTGAGCHTLIARRRRQGAYFRPRGGREAAGLVGRERVFAVRLRIPTGAQQLGRLGLAADETSHVLQRAVDRAYPFLEREAIRNNFLWSTHGKALDVQIIVPRKLGWTPDQLRSPHFQQRLITGFHHALAQVGPTRLGPSRELLPSVVRGAAIVRQAPQILRQAEQDPERAARDLARAAFSKLSEALPKPFRLMRDLGRTMSRFVARGE